MSVAEAVIIAEAAETARCALSLSGEASSAAGPSAPSGAGGSSHPYSPPSSGASGLTRMDGHGAAAVRCIRSDAQAPPVATAGGGWAGSDDTYSWWTGLPGGGAALQSRAPPSASSGLGSGMSSLLGAGATCMDVEEDGTGAVEADAGAGLDSLVASAYLTSPPAAGFSGEGGAPSMTPQPSVRRAARARARRSTRRVGRLRVSMSVCCAPGAGPRSWAVTSLRWWKVDTWCTRGSLASCPRRRARPPWRQR